MIFRSDRMTAEILQAIQANDSQISVQLLENLLKKQKGGWTKILPGEQSRLRRELESAVIAAAKSTDSAILRYLLEEGVNVNFTTSSALPGIGATEVHQTPLHIAVNSGNHENIKLLLKHRTDPNMPNHNGRTSLHLAARRADAQAARLLVNHGTTVNVIDVNGKTPLQLAAHNGHSELVRVLLEFSASLNHPGQTPPNALHVAAIEGHLTLIDVFSQYVDINITDIVDEKRRRASALHLASERGMNEVVRHLLEKYGASVGSREEPSGNTPMHSAVATPHDPKTQRKTEEFDQVVQLLVQKSADVNAKNKEGETPLFLSVKNGFTKITEILLMSKADPRLTNRHGMTAQILAQNDPNMTQVFAKYKLFSSPYLAGIELPSDVNRNAPASISRVEGKRVRIVEPGQMPATIAAAEGKALKINLHASDSVRVPSVKVQSYKTAAPPQQVAMNMMQMSASWPNVNGGNLKHPNGGVAVLPMMDRNGTVRGVPVMLSAGQLTGPLSTPTSPVMQRRGQVVPGAGAQTPGVAILTSPQMARRMAQGGTVLVRAPVATPSILPGGVFPPPAGPMMMPQQVMAAQPVQPGYQPGYQHRMPVMQGGGHPGMAFSPQLQRHVMAPSAPPARWGWSEAAPKPEPRQNLILRTTDIPREPHFQCHLGAHGSIMVMGHTGYRY